MKRSGERCVIDLCDEPSPPRKDSAAAGRERSADRGEAHRRHKRRRLETPLGRTVVELSDGEEDEAASDVQLARRLQEAERGRLRADLDADLRLARRLQDEEHRANLSPFGGMFGLDPVSGAGLANAPPGLHGGRWDWLGSLARRPGLGGLLAGQGLPFAGAGGPPGRGYMLPAQLRRPGAGQFGHLELMDRDFGEADYEMLLRLDERNDSQKKEKLRANCKALDQLPSRRLSKSEARSECACAICLETMRANQLVITLPCKHEYHKPCILKWLKSCEAPSCPTCKAPVLAAAAAAAARPDAPRAVSTEDADDDDGSEEWYHT